MKMSKKVREYKTGDFIFAKVKGYPAWPARVQRLNGKKYYVYFYGTGETANLPSNMIFDYMENKDKFLTKTVKRKDFNLGVKQIEHDFANNVPVEQVVPGFMLSNDTGLNDTANESSGNNTFGDSTVSEADTTADNDTTTQEKARKSTAKTPKTPRGKAKKDEYKDDEDEEKEEKKEEEIISRSGRKIRPKRYIDEQTDDLGTLPASKKRRGASPSADKEKDTEKEKQIEKEKQTDKEKQTEKEKAQSEAAVAKEKIDKYKHFNAVRQMELEDLKEPFTQDEADKNNILIAYMPNGQYVGIKLFQSRPANFNNEATRLKWDKQAALNAIKLKMLLERGHITAQSINEQLVMDLQLTDEEKATLDKERETEEQKSRLQFLKTEMKLIELDAKIKTCLSLQKADTEQCLKLLDELADLDLKRLMLWKHPACLETIKRMRAYVGNTLSWDLSDTAEAVFNKHAQEIRKKADMLYIKMENLFTIPEGLSFWEYFREQVSKFKSVTSNLAPDEYIEIIHEPIEMSTPTALTIRASLQAANEGEDSWEENINSPKKGRPAKAKKTNGTLKSPPKKQSSRKQQEEEEGEAEEDANIEDGSEESTNNKQDPVKETNTEENKNSEEPMEIEEEVQEPVKNNEVDKETVLEEAKEVSEKSKRPNSNGSDNSSKENNDGKEEEKIDAIKEKRNVGEPGTKRTRESKKNEPAQQRSLKRKSKH